jgi:hypothetical protein
LLDFVFASTDLLGTEEEDRINLYFALFSTCYSSRRFVELCHGLLVLFNGPTPDKDTVLELSVHVRGNHGSNINLYDYVMGKVTFGKAQTTTLYAKIHQDILSKFPTTSTKNYAKRKKDDQLAIMRYVVISMFIKYKGNGIDTKTKSRDGRHAAPVGLEWRIHNPRLWTVKLIGCRYRRAFLIIISVYLVYRQASTHILCRQSYCSALS